MKQKTYLPAFMGSAILKIFYPLFHILRHLLDPFGSIRNVRQTRMTDTDLKTKQKNINNKININYCTLNS